MEKLIVKSIGVRQTATVLRHSLRSPLGRPARRARVGLLLVSVLSLVATQTGLLPTDVLAPHLRWQLQNYMTLLKFVLFFNIVLLITFITCSLLDCLNWRRYGSPAEPPEPVAEAVRGDAAGGLRGHDSAAPVSRSTRLRLLIDLALPCLLGLYAIGAAVRIMVLNYMIFSLHP